MSGLIRTPDVGSDEGEAVELLVKPGDKVEADQSLLILESDKASMEIPSPKAGVVKSIKARVGDTLKEGDGILELEAEGGKQPAEIKIEATPAQPEAPKAETPAPVPGENKPAVPAVAGVQGIKAPDIGSAGKINATGVVVKASSTIEADQLLITLESDKASMEIPSPASGMMEGVSIKVGDEVGTDDLILKLKMEDAAPAAEEQLAAAPAQVATPATEQRLAVAAPVPVRADTSAPVDTPSCDDAKIHVGPAVRMLAREFGAELSEVKTNGLKGRILKEDVQVFVREQLQHAKSGGTGTTDGAGVPPILRVDFSKFGGVEKVVMTHLIQVGIASLHRSWLNVSHAIQFGQPDIIDMEVSYVAQKAVAGKIGVKLTVPPILLKAYAHPLKELPNLNSSLTPGGRALIHKKYVHIDFAVDAPDGLLVLAIYNADRKSLLQLAAETAELANRARNKRLSADATQGVRSTISSLGHIDSTGFTLIVNASEVAILGASKATMQPVWDGKVLRSCLILPLSLSYDHHAINGVAAARFTKRLGELLADVCTLFL